MVEDELEDIFAIESEILPIEIVKQKTIENSIFYDIAKKYYGEDKVDYFKEGSLQGIYIHYPEITIYENKNRASFHKITDLYIKIVLDGKRFCRIIAIQGDTFTRTYDEYNSSYRHSHICAEQSNSWSNFCLGESDLNLLKIESVEDSWNEDKLELFFFTLDTYLSCEHSPYMYLKNIGQYNNNSIPISNYTIKDIFKNTNILNTLEYIEDFTSSNQNIEILYNEESLKILIDYLTIKNKEYLGIYNPNKGIALPLQTNKKLGLHDTIRSSNFIFKGNKINLRIYDPNFKEELIELDYYPLPQVFEAIKNIIKNDFQQKINI